MIVDEKNLPQISTEAVQNQLITVDRKATGKIAFNEDRLTPVFTPYTGRVVDLLANKGNSVKAGQPATGDRPGATSPGCYDAPQSGIP